jgi:hypothetical protein
MATPFDKKLGIEAEKVVKQFFESKGHKFTLSADKYDSEKDAILIPKNSEEKYNTEIKLSTRYKIFNSLTVTLEDENTSIVYGNQLSKCSNVDVLIFCQRPEKNDPVFKIYQAPPVGLRYFDIKRNAKDNRLVAHFYIDKLKLIGIITDKEIVNKFMIKEKVYA